MFTESLRCEICTGSDVKFWRSIAARTSTADASVAYDHFGCRSCGHLFVHPKPSPAELAAYYDDARFYREATDQSDRLVREARERAERLASVCQSRGLPLNLIDVGCASGVFLEEARRVGFEAVGVELSSVLADEARARGFTVHQGALERLELPADQAPLVTTWEVIEHVTDPKAMMRELLRLVKPQGLLSLSTPRIDGLPALLLGERFPMISPPEHLSLFSRQSLERLLEQANAETLTFRSFSNLGRENLERGFLKHATSRLPIPTAWQTRSSKALAWLASFLPDLVDSMGMGTEMELLVVKRSGA